MIDKNRNLPSDDLDELCWRLVNSAIDFECEMTVCQVEELEDQYGAGFLNAKIAEIDYLYNILGVDVVGRAEKVGDCVPFWVEDNGFDVEPRMEQGTFTCIPEDGILPEGQYQLRI